MIGALGDLKNRKAIPRLAELIRNSEIDSDTPWAAMQSLGQIVRKRFDKKADPMAAAQEWLMKHHY
jgi:hypothetical protein